VRFDPNPARPDFMRISDITFTILHHALSRRYGDARGLKTRRQSIVVEVITDQGLNGWGEFSPGPVAPGRSLLAEVTGCLIGQDPIACAPLIQALGRFGSRICGGIDIALADIRGKAAGLALARLFGGPFRARQPAYASLQNASDDADVTAAAMAEAERAMALGFRHLKMKIAWHSPAVDIVWINAVLRALPPEVTLAIDANRMLDPVAALRLARGIEAPQRISWFEEPISNRVPEAHRDLRAALPDFAIAGAESVPVPVIERLVAGRMLDIINPDLVSHGGFAMMQRLAVLCDVHGVRLVPHVFDGQLVRVATLHWLAAQPGWEEAHGPFATAPVEYDISPNPLRDELLEVPLRPDADGLLAVLEGPGLGVAVNRDVLRRFGQAVEC
jgi:D-galactarolactone cycloisomerase